MNKNNDFFELIAKASASVSIMNSLDVSELNELGSVINEIRENAANSSDLPEDLASCAIQNTEEAAKWLEKLAAKDIETAEEAVKQISQAVHQLQQMCDAVDFLQEPEVEPELISETKGTVIPEEDVPLVLDFIAESNEHIEGAESALLELENDPSNEEILNKIFRAFHTIKGMAGFLNLTDIGSLAHSAENLLDLARKGKLLLTGLYCDIAFESIDMLKKMIAGLNDAVSSNQPIATNSQLPQMLEKLKNAAEGQFDIQKTETAKNGTVCPDDITIEENVAPQQQNLSDSQKKTSINDDKIKVSIGRLDNLVNMVGELVIAQLMVAEEVNNNHITDFNLMRKVSHQSKIIRELQELSMSMRMVPISGVFQKMTRLVRDLSHKSGKEINFVTRGEDTELDRTIVDKIADPLVHMIRNSIDHGIEPADERAKIGKSNSGKLELRAFHQAGNIVIEIEDDGKGLDKERILKKAIENKIVSPDQDISDDEIYKLIFHAGLSTAQKITAISGRGVGMDVVRKNIEALRGRVEISTMQGRGTTFTIKLPLTLAIIDGQIVRVGQTKYIVPINTIIHSARPTREHLTSVQSRGEMAIVRGELLPMVRLHSLFNVTPSTQDPTQASLVVVENEGKRCSLLVDELLEQQQVVIKNLGAGMGSVKGISGGAIMGNGLVSLILDVPGIIELSKC